MGKRYLENMVFGNKYLTISAYIANNYFQFLKLNLFPEKTSNSARAYARLDCATELEKLGEEYSIYQRFISKKSLQQKSILEIGTGSYFLTALLYLSKGTKRFISIDRFNCLRKKEERDYVHGQMMKTLSPLERKNLCGAYSEKTNEFLKSGRFDYFQKAFENFNPDEKFDYIVSYAVLEHIWDIDSVAKKSKDLLKPGGRFIAFIGNNDHGMFSRKFPWYEYYTIPEWVYKNMVALSGRPNRYTPDIYISAFKKQGLSAKVYLIKDRKGNYYKNFREYIKMSPGEMGLEHEITRFDLRYKLKPKEEFWPEYFVLVAEMPSKRVNTR